MLLLAVLSCGMVSCQQEEGLASATLAKLWWPDKSYILVDSLYYTIDTENKKATIEFFKKDACDYEMKTHTLKFPNTVTYNNIEYPIKGLGAQAVMMLESTSTDVNSFTIPMYYSITLPEQLETIDEHVFEQQECLKNITIPQSVKSIGEFAFYKCNSLKSIELPKGLKYIANAMFAECTDLAEVNFPDELYKIGSGAFYECTSLKSIILPESVTQLDSCYCVYIYPLEGKTFAGCTSLLTAKIPNVETIPLNCFDGDTQLQNVTLGAGVKTIMKDAFKDCTNLKQLCVYATTPPTLKDANIFSSTNYENCTLYVPESALETYKAADGWKNFKNISTTFPEDQTAEEMQASFTDDNPTLAEGTYKPGKLTYTRTGKNIVADNYATFCLPFDINLADTKCFSDVLIPMNIALYQTNNNGMLTLMLDQVDSDAIISAGQPFIAKLNGQDVELKNYYSTFIRSTYETDLKQNMENTIKVFNFDGSSGVLQRNNDVEVKFCGAFNKKTEMDQETTRTFTVRGSFAPDTSVNAFRAYIYKNSKSGNTKVSNLEWGLGDALQSIPSGTYIVDGEKLIINK